MQRKIIHKEMRARETQSSRLWIQVSRGLRNKTVTDSLKRGYVKEGPKAGVRWGRIKWGPSSQNEVVVETSSQSKELSYCNSKGRSGWNSNKDDLRSGHRTLVPRDSTLFCSSCFQSLGWDSFFGAVKGPIKNNTGTIWYLFIYFPPKICPFWTSVENNYGRSLH